MRYHNVELTPITTPQIFDTPREMLVWDYDYAEPTIKRVCAILTNRDRYAVITVSSCYDYCAEIPEESKPKRATNIQLMEWLSKGNGMWKRKDEIYAYTHIPIYENLLEKEVEEYIFIRPFGSTEWLEPTLDNMGMVNHEQEKEKE